MEGWLTNDLAFGKPLGGQGGRESSLGVRGGHWASRHLEMLLLPSESLEHIFSLSANVHCQSNEGRE